MLFYLFYIISLLVGFDIYAQDIDGHNIKPARATIGAPLVDPKYKIELLVVAAK
jgi:enamine deaminase RidA (YjgF/YER057c/UK114 family)